MIIVIYLIMQKYSLMDVWLALQKMLMNYINNWNIKNEKEFSTEFSYNNSDKKFELKQYEKNIQENLTDKLIEQITLYLYDN